MRHYRARPAEERRRRRRKNAKSLFFTSRSAYVNLRHIDVIHSFDCKSAIKHVVVFRMHDSVPSARYSSFCNVLHLWNILLIPTYRVYLLSDR